MLKKIKSDNVFNTQFINVDKYTLKDQNDKIFEYFVTSTQDGVIVVPIRIKDNKVSFVLTKQIRVASGAESIEFPKGAINIGEAPEVAAQRELLEETGFKAQWVKFFYTNFSSPASSSKMFVYLALLSDEPRVPVELDELEIAAELGIVEVTADDLLKMIKSNEILDGQSLTALTVIMLQTGTAAQYLETLGVK